MNRFEKTDHNTVIDHITGLEWQADATEPITWQEAMAYASGLGDGWRLPSVEELTTLIGYNRSNPATGFPDHPSAWFWSSSILANYPRSAWLVSFSYGYVYYNAKYYSYHVRCVRDCQKKGS